MSDIQSLAQSFASDFERSRITVVLAKTCPTRQCASDLAVWAGYDVCLFTNVFAARNWRNERNRDDGRAASPPLTHARLVNEARYARRTVVDLHDELRYWRARFGAKRSELRTAAEAVGLDIKSIETYLNQHGRQCDK